MVYLEKISITVMGGNIIRHPAKTSAMILTSAICIYLVWVLTNPDSQAS